MANIQQALHTLVAAHKDKRIDRPYLKATRACQEAIYNAVKQEQVEQAHVDYAWQHGEFTVFVMLDNLRAKQ